MTAVLKRAPSIREPEHVFEPIRLSRLNSSTVTGRVSHESVVEQISGSSNSSSDIATNTEDENEYPDGGLTAWLTLFGSFMGLTASLGLINSIGSLQAYITDHQLADLRSPSAASGWIFAVFLSMTYAGGTFSGILLDEIGVKTPLIAGSLLCVIGLLGTANCHTVGQFIFTFGLVCGLGTAITANVLIGVIPHWFKRRLGISMGICTLGGSVGGAIFPLMLKTLYQEVGFVWAIRILALVCSVLFLVALVLVKERLSEARATVVESDIQQSWRTKLTEVTRYLRNAVDIKAMKSPVFTFCVLAMSFSEFSVFCTTTYLASYAIATGVSESNAYLMLTLCSTIGAFGRLIPSRISDIVGPFNVTVAMIGITALSNFAIWLAFGEDEKALWAFIIIYGFFSSSVLSLSPVCCRVVSPTKDFGKRFATSYLVAGMVSFAGLPVAGALIGSGSSITSYNHFIIFVGSIALAGEACWIVCRFFIVGTKFNVRV